MLQGLKDDLKNDYDVFRTARVVLPPLRLLIEGGIRCLGQSLPNVGRFGGDLPHNADDRFNPNRASVWTKFRSDYCYI
jgi:hypothetical protein